MKLWQKGLIILAAGLICNSVFRTFDIGGIVRELSRIAILVGTVISLIGAVRRK